MDKKNSMTVGDFESLLDRCGSGRGDWPTGEREAADRLFSSVGVLRTSAGKRKR